MAIATPSKLTSKRLRERQDAKDRFCGVAGLAMTSTNPRQPEGFATLSRLQFDLLAQAPIDGRIAVTGCSRLISEACDSLLPIAAAHAVLGAPGGAARVREIIQSLSEMQIANAARIVRARKGDKNDLDVAGTRCDNALAAVSYIVDRSEYLTQGGQMRLR